MKINSSDVRSHAVAAATFVGLCFLLWAVPLRGQASRCGSDKDCTNPAPSKVLKRIDIDSLSADQLQSLRNGTQAMLDLDEKDPLSHRYLAFIHGTSRRVSPLPAAWNCCQHSTWFFLSWHRIEIFYYERILRALSGDDTLTAPYWNFTVLGGAKRAVPESFRKPTYVNKDKKEVPNPLYFRARRAGLNDGKPLCDEIVDWRAAFAKDKFFVTTGAGAASFGGRSSDALRHGVNGPGTGSLENVPHNIVHLTVGDGTYDSLSNPDGAGLDPLFWPIHVNLDRAWVCWQAAHPGTLPEDTSDWAKQKFKFFDVEKTLSTGPNGEAVTAFKAKEVCLTGKQVVDTAKQLGYEYDNCDPFPKPRPGRDGPAQGAGSVAVPSNLVTTSLQSAVSLGEEPVTISMSLPADVQRRIGSLLKGEVPETSIVLVVEDIQMDRPPNTFYEVYLNLPTTEKLDYEGRYYAGNLNFFGVTPQHSHDEMGATTATARSFDITDVVRQLAANGEWAADKVAVTFAASRSEEDCVKPPRSEADVQVGFAQLTLGVITVEPAPK